MSEFPPLRGQVYWYDLHSFGRKPFVVVSANERNRQLDTILAARISTTPAKNSPTWVELSPEDSPVVGSVIADDIEQVYTDDLLEQLGALCRNTMASVDRALAFALGLI